MRIRGKMGLFTIGITLGFSPVTGAQQAYLSTLSYSNSSISRLGSIPGLGEASFDNFHNATFDQNQQRYFFLGNSTTSNAQRLYVVSAVSGAVLDSSYCPPSPTQGAVFGMQYDPVGDTLYALYADAQGNVSFVWIDPAVGAITIKSAIPVTGYFAQTAFDNADHLFIMTNQNWLMTIDARTGIIVYQVNYPTYNGVYDMVFDNRTQRLYGAGSSAVTGLSGFYWVSMATGVEHLIAPIPDFGYPSTNAYAVDETTGKYLFVADFTLSQDCQIDSLYALDVQTGSIVSSAFYPYSSTTVPSEKLLINFSMDNQRDRLYALNWEPAIDPGAPSVSISATAAVACLGKADTFSAAALHAGTFPQYQWQRNGINVGTNNPVYIDTSLNEGDSVSCILTPASSCTIGTGIVSNKIAAHIIPIPSSSLTIATPTLMACSADTLVFKTYPQSGGSAPLFYWTIDGIYYPAGKETFTVWGLRSGDTIACTMTPSLTCAMPATSNNLVVTISPSPTVFAGNDTVVSPGTSLHLVPVVGGSVSGYQWIPATGLDDPYSPQPVATPATTTDYQLTVTASDGCTASGKREILVYYPIRMPGAFTPNGDGINDVFRIPPSTPQVIRSFRIYDRWGQLVFSTDNGATGWDGTFRNQREPVGTYVWRIEYVDLLTGKTALARGTVVMIR